MLSPLRNRRILSVIEPRLLSSKWLSEMGAPIALLGVLLVLLKLSEATVWGVAFASVGFSFLAAGLLRFIFSNGWA